MIIVQNLIFIFELLIAEGLIVFRLKRQNYFFLKLFLSLVGIVLIAVFTPYIDNPFYSCFFYFFLFFTTLIGIKICFKGSFLKLFFFGVAAYTFQHIAYELFEFFAVVSGISNVEIVIGSGVYDAFLIYSSNGNSFVSGNPFTIIVYVFIYYITYVIGYLATSKRITSLINSDYINMKTSLIGVLILFFDIIVSVFIADFNQGNMYRGYFATLNVFNIFCCLIALYLLFMEESRGRLETSLQIITRLFKEKEKQYQENKMNINLINQKCHDLKHQIREIGKNKYIDENVVKEIEDTISIYDANVKTGNEPLDIILTEKSLYCIEKNIKLCCIVDGDLLTFMSAGDLYSLFGNIIDNAIEAVEPLPLDKRTISLSIKKNNSFITINIHNYYDGNIVFEDKLPKTTKKDSAYHGYGMKSVKYLVDKYQGEMSIKTSNQVFNLNILFFN